MLRGGGDNGPEPKMCQKRDVHLEGREVYVIMWGSMQLRCVGATLGKRTAHSVCSASLDYTDQTTQHPHRRPWQLPTVTESSVPGSCLSRPGGLGLGQESVVLGLSLSPQHLHIHPGKEDTHFFFLALE